MIIHATRPRAAGAGLPAERFLQHKGLLLVAAGGALAEAGLLTLLAPAARPVAPQATALPVLAAYHDLRWLFADSQSWPLFAGTLTLALLLRSAIDMVMLRLAWPRGSRAPRSSRAFWSCLTLTALAWLLLSPAVTLTFGVAMLPFSWPFLAALPILVGIAIALSHGGVHAAWWRRLPPLRSVVWLLASIIVLSAAAAVLAHLGTAAAIAVSAGTGLVNARAWYGTAGIAARLHPQAHESVPARLLFGMPVAALAALAALALVVGVARLMFTGTIQLPAGRSAAVGSPLAARSVSVGGADGADSTFEVGSAATDAVLVVGGWGSSCCGDANGLQAALPGFTVRQFSYTGLDAQGRAMPSGPSADDLPLPELGDLMAAQLETLHRHTRRPVDVVAESEGTLGVYAMLARHPGLPVGSIVLLSPIVDPGQLSYPPGPDGPSVPEDALTELNHLVGSMSPYGPSGAHQLLSSVSEHGARYFGAATEPSGNPARLLTVIPLADALTLPVCSLQTNVVVVPAFHGGLLGDGSVLPVVSAFLTGRPVTWPVQGKLRDAAEVISSAATAWRMPVAHPACPQ
ncbi:MAG TPA: hypothetical protein VGH53_21875 [Streptosporangiaceae bacterium]|jgi:hypothetical protein